MDQMDMLIAVFGLIVSIAAVSVSYSEMRSQLKYRMMVLEMDDDGTVGVGIRLSGGIVRANTFQASAEYICKTDWDGGKGTWTTYLNDSDTLFKGGMFTFDFVCEGTKDKYGYVAEPLSGKRAPIDDGPESGHGALIYHLRVSLEDAKKWDAIVWFDEGGVHVVPYNGISYRILRFLRMESLFSTYRFRNTFYHRIGRFQDATETLRGIMPRSGDSLEDAGVHGVDD